MPFGPEGVVRVGEARAQVLSRLPPDHAGAPGGGGDPAQALEQALLDRANGKAVRSGAIMEFNKRLASALRQLARFETIVDNTLVNNKLAMAAWKVARFVEPDFPRSKRKVEAAPEPTTRSCVARPIRTPVSMRCSSRASRAARIWRRSAARSTCR